MRQTGLHLQMLVSDDGCGLFQRIEQAWQIDDPHLAMLELGKGKLTTQPARHLGQGLFYVARAADVFDLHANRHGFADSDADQYAGYRWYPGRGVA